MRLLAILLVGILASSCASKQETGSPPPRVAGPDVALREAEAYLAKLSPQPADSEREEIRTEFTQMFFSGFTNPTGGLIGRDAAEHGFHAGQNLRRHCDAVMVRRIMEDYGYVATEATGTWAVRFEVSVFSPRDMPDQGWWLEGFGDTKYTYPKKGEETDQPVYFRISGFLSPKGRYGHLGGYEHEFYATKVVYVKDGH
jgi:hypothetical protein